MTGWRSEDELRPLFFSADETDPEEWERVKREMRKKDAEIKQVQEEATRRYRTDPLYRRLEPLREDIRRRLGW